MGTLIYLVQFATLVIICLACFRSLSYDLARIRDLLEGVADLIATIDAAKVADSQEHVRELDRLKGELRTLRDSMDAERDQYPLPPHNAPATRNEARSYGKQET